jgi:nicotinate-nucleotide pyrophosphorylase (carboxylating)
MSAVGNRMDSLDRVVRDALAEDVGTGDVTSRGAVSEDATAEASILVKQPGVVCGLDAAAAVFRALDPQVTSSRSPRTATGSRRFRPRSLA